MIRFDYIDVLIRQMLRNLRPGVGLMRFSIRSQILSHRFLKLFKCLPLILLACHTCLWDLKKCIFLFVSCTICQVYNIFCLQLSSSWHISLITSAEERVLFMGSFFVWLFFS